MSKRIQSLVWGSVITNGKKFYLLEAEPDKSSFWSARDFLKWQVCDSEGFEIVREDLQNRLIYKASHIIFGKDACIEILDNPQKSIIVEYFESEEEVSVAPV